MCAAARAGGGLRAAPHGHGDQAGREDQQRAVNGLGCTPALVVDGPWGSKTDAGVRRLQGKVGAGADGLWGPATETAYKAYTGGGSGGGGTSVRSVKCRQWTGSGAPPP
ncbi:peptidoglycan-binding domain-containing protein [Streptomyces diastatochromogenes]|uniref:Peptidoglycan binding-like domain-containing protein n=1 Tax=Streptomyces diastatochromogenes TaxID=42236 RepID=A0A233SC31_STRDA|nr:peptidoglycan-binding protein [Streptomyces diastatochromogenes]OXY93218.1 hypothetical protein BEK98_23670 [Streptomyces diastatochromogenes]